jgi:hypothetical protein
VTQDTAWLAVPDLVTLLGQPVGRIHRLIEEHRLPATRRNGPLQVPALCVRDGEPLSELRGTLLVLLDQGLTEDEAIDWLLAEDDSLGTSPIAAMRAGGKSSVRRAAQLLG